MALLGFNEVSFKDLNSVGGKGASLGELMRSGINVPDGFVVPVEVFDAFVRTNNLNRKLVAFFKNELSASKIYNAFISARVSSRIEDDIFGAFRVLGDQLVAVRSSAIVEDAVGASWAGHFQSFLNTPRDALLVNIKRCWASVATEHVRSYLKQQCGKPDDIRMAVIIQQMVRSEAAGVLFSSHPITKDREHILLEVVAGLGDGLVAGRVTPDRYVIGKTPVQIREIKLAAEVSSPIVSDRIVLKLAKLASRIESSFGYPIDLEWACVNNAIFVLQCRPITAI